MGRGVAPNGELVVIPEICQIPGVLLTPLAIRSSLKGTVLHGIKRTDPGFAGFAEAYFSTVETGVTKGWKRHREMTLNLVVPVGAIEFVLYDDRAGSPTIGLLSSVRISPENYARLTVPPGVWLAFKGLSPGLNLLMNCANIVHDPLEADNVDPGTENLPEFPKE